MSRKPASVHPALSLFLMLLFLLPMACGSEEGVDTDTAVESDTAVETDAVAEADPAEGVDCSPNTPAGPATTVPKPTRANAPDAPSPDAVATGTICDLEVTITYGSPGVKGREIWGGLVPYGQVWRAGANEATAIHFTHDVTVEGQPLAAGVYAFFTIPTETEWTLIFNKVADQWGAFDYDESQDALRVTVTPEEGPQQERLTYSFEEASATSITAVLAWDTLRVPFTIALP